MRQGGTLPPSRNEGSTSTNIFVNISPRGAALKRAPRSLRLNRRRQAAPAKTEGATRFEYFDATGFSRPTPCPVCRRGKNSIDHLIRCSDMGEPARDFDAPVAFLRELPFRSGRDDTRLPTAISPLHTVGARVDGERFLGGRA